MFLRWSAFLFHMPGGTILVWTTRSNNVSVFTSDGQSKELGDQGIHTWKNFSLSGTLPPNIPWIFLFKKLLDMKPWKYVAESFLPRWDDEPGTKLGKNVGQSMSKVRDATTL